MNKGGARSIGVHRERASSEPEPLHRPAGEVQLSGGPIPVNSIYFSIAPSRFKHLEHVSHPPSQALVFRRLRHRCDFQPNPCAMPRAPLWALMALVLAVSASAKPAPALRGYRSRQEAVEAAAGIAGLVREEPRRPGSACSYFVATGGGRLSFSLSNWVQFAGQHGSHPAGGPQTGVDQPLVAPPVQHATLAPLHFHRCSPRTTRRTFGSSSRRTTARATAMAAPRWVAAGPPNSRTFVGAHPAGNTQ